MSHEGRTSNVLGCSTWNNQLADRYLGKQGTKDDKGAMEQGKRTLPRREDLESDCGRLGTESVNATVQSFKGGFAQDSEGIEEHCFS